MPTLGGFDNAMTIADSGSVDAFGRLRISNPETVFATHSVMGMGTDFYEHVLTGGGSISHIANESAVRLHCGTASGDKVVRQSRRYLRYTPGKSQMIAMTCVLGAAKANVRKRIGYFDAADGVFLEQTSTGPSFVRRTNVTGSPVNNAVAQADWNVDTFDGNGPSGLTLDLTKAQIVEFDLQWLGMGRIRCGFNVNGVLHVGHQFLNSNTTLTKVYMSRGSLPVRVELENTGLAASATDIDTVCNTVISEGGTDSGLSSHVRSVNNGVTAIGVTTRQAVIAIRPKATFNGLVVRSSINIIDATLHNTGNQSALVELVRNPVLAGGGVGSLPTWNSASTSSTVEYATNCTTVTGGEIIWSGYSFGGNAASRVEIPLDKFGNTDIPLTLDIAGANPTPMALVVTSYGASTACVGSLTWREMY